MAANLSIQRTSRTNVSHKIPSFLSSSGELGSNDAELLDCLYNMIDSSKAFLRSNRTFRVAEICRDIIYGRNKPKVSREISVEISKLRRQGIEMIGTAANIRPNFSIRGAKIDQNTQDKAATYEELKDHWWRDRVVNAIVKEAVTEAASGLGYIFTWPEKDPNTGKYEITPKALSYKEVFPYQIGADGDIDKAYSVTVWCELPFAEFEEKFPEFAGKFAPDRNAPSYMSKSFQDSKKGFGGGITATLRRGIEKKTDAVIDPSFPMKDVFYTFTRDPTINRTGKTVRMGTLLNGDLAGHDSYEVPSYEPGTNAKEECKLFPRRRLTIWVKDAILYDGPPKWICDCVPVAPFRFKKFPKEYIGDPVLNDGRSLEAAIERMINSIVARIHGAANFPIAVDEGFKGNLRKRLESKGIAGLIGRALFVNLRLVQKPIQALFDRELFKIESHEFEVVKALSELLDYVVGTNDYSNLQRKNQVPAADTVEAYVKSMGVLSDEHEKNISAGIERFGRIVLQFFPQVYTLRKRILAVGSKAVDLQEFDYDPTNMIPSLDPRHQGLPYWKRLEMHMEKFNLFAASGSLQEKQSVTNKLTTLQALKAGVRISDRKIYDALISDGKYEESVAQWTEEQKEKAKLAAMIRKEVEAIAGAAGSTEGQGILQQILAQLNLQNTSNVGRPSSNETMPRLENKMDEDGIPRGTAATYS